MSRRLVSDKEMEAVLKLDGPGRYARFVKQVAAWREAWGLYSDGWAMGCDDDGKSTFQLWPAKEYAQVCAKDEWDGYEASEISIQDLLEELFPKLEQDGVGLGIFRTPNGESVMPSIEQLAGDLRNEMSRYE